VNAAAGVAAAAGFSPTGRAQAARANQDKLNRIAIMTLNFSNMLKLPGQAPSEQRIYEVFDIPTSRRCTRTPTACIRSSSSTRTSCRPSRRI
jgi:hypothetical protein